tara:strand:+ start:11073 stop:11609 length:537 start_codon:yes stop_codon:yes gene_type:complete
MDDSLESLTEKIGSPRNFDTPPLHLWHPELSGDIPIVINTQGEWYHDGGKIERESLVHLFASILRREDDGEYYLVTPAEKWRINVERHALLVTDVDIVDEGDRRVLEATLNTGRRVQIDRQCSLFLDQEVGGIAALNLPHGLTALCTRAAWYRLVALAEMRGDRAVLTSGDYEFAMPT